MARQAGHVSSEDQPDSVQAESVEDPTSRDEPARADQPGPKKEPASPPKEPARPDVHPLVKELPERFVELGSFIREQRSSARLSLRRLSELAGISNPYLSQIERGLRRPSAEILQQIAKALRISAETLYVQAGILERPDGDSDLSRHILADPHLTEEQRQAMMRIYLSFRHENDDQAAGRAARARHESEERVAFPSADPDGPGAVASVSAANNPGRGHESVEAG
jgi:transcriptional regulator with XRE-family HTH domain